MSSKPLTVQPDFNPWFGSNKLLHDRQCKYKKKDYLWFYIYSEELLPNHTSVKEINYCQCQSK